MPREQERSTKATGNSFACGLCYSNEVNDLKGMVAGLVLLFGTGVLLVLFGLSSWGVQAELGVTEDRLQEFLLTWSSYQVALAQKKPEAIALRIRCQQQLRAVLASPVWKPMVALKRLAPDEMTNLANHWEDSSATALSVLTELKAFMTKQESVDRLLQLLLLITFFGLALIAGVLVVWQAGRHKMENTLRNLHQKSLAAIEEERKALARELHDTVAQDLAAAKILLSVPSVPEEPGNRITANIDSALTHVRALAIGLRPPSLDKLGFAAALRELADSVAQRFGVNVFIDISNTDHLPLDNSMTINVYRIAQEALQNAARHSEGNRIDVVLRQNTVGLDLEIADNGKGLGSAASGRLGLVGMYERARLIGARLTIEPLIPGTRIHLEVPYENPHRR